MPYDLSDSVPIAVDVKDSAGALTNASTAVLTITQPDGSSSIPAVANPPSVTGEYRVTFIPTQVGLHAWRFATTAPATAYQDVFVVRAAISPALLSLGDAKKHLNVTSTTNDDEMREYLEGTTRVVEQHVGPVVIRTHTARRCGGQSQIVLPHTQVRSIVSVTLVSDGSTPITISDLTVDSASGIVSYKNGSPIPYGDYDIVYTVGRDVVEPNWTLAAKMIFKHNWLTQLGNLPSNQGDDRGYVVTGSGYLVPYRAISLMSPDQVPLGFA